MTVWLGFNDVMPRGFVGKGVWAGARPWPGAKKTKELVCSAILVCKTPPYT